MEIAKYHKKLSEKLVVKPKLNKSNLTYRKLKLSDYSQFNKLFYHSFNKKISYEFFKWRYFNDRYSFCYGAFESSRLVANVGMFSAKLNNSNQEKLFSRHSSMVLEKYRGEGVFSDLLSRVKKIISRKVRLVVMWPNKNNFANFGINKDKIIKKKFYLYKTFSKPNLSKVRKIYKIDSLIINKYLNKSKDSFFFKDLNYFKNRYISYQKHEYFIDKFEFKKNKSFYILKFNKNNHDPNYVIVDHFGCKKIKSKHLSILIKNQKKMIFLSQKKISKPNVELLNNLYLQIGFIKGYSLREKKSFLKKEFFLGDTDIFMTI